LLKKYEHSKITKDIFENGDNAILPFKIENSGTAINQKAIGFDHRRL
jgi:hypothetical protein